MTRGRRKFRIASQLFVQLQAFAKEMCEQSVQAGDGALLMVVEGVDKGDTETYIRVALVGRSRVASQLIKLCIAAEEGRISYPQPINLKSRPVGKVGEKIDTEVVLYSSVDYDSVYGHTYIYRFRDVFGNELSWRTTSNKTHPRGTYLLSGRVKEHHAEGKTTVTRLGYVKLREKA
jgi:hypothetical protein